MTRSLSRRGLKGYSTTIQVEWACLLSTSTPHQNPKVPYIFTTSQERHPSCQLTHWHGTRFAALFNDILPHYIFSAFFLSFLFGYLSQPFINNNNNKNNNKSTLGSLPSRQTIWMTPGVLWEGGLRGRRGRREMSWRMSMMKGRETELIGRGGWKGGWGVRGLLLMGRRMGMRRVGMEGRALLPSHVQGAPIKGKKWAFERADIQDKAQDKWSNGQTQPNESHTAENETINTWTFPRP